jgi:uncharacterized protein
MLFFLVPLLGLMVSVVSVFLGLGGGVILVPLLPLLFGFSVHEAVATSVTTIAFVVAENTHRFHRHNWVNWPVVLYMGPVSALSAFIAAIVVVQVPERILLMVLVFILSLIGLRSIYFSLSRKNYDTQPLNGLRRLYLVLGGVLAGVTSGFIGIGSGVILSPVMIFARVIQPIQLTPTANANMLFTTTAAALGFLVSGQWQSWTQWGNIRLDIVLGVFISASLFSRWLRPMQNRLPFRVKSLLLGLLLVALIIKTIIQLGLPGL